MLTRNYFNNIEIEVESNNRLTILIDGRPMLHQRSGIGRYTYQLLLSLFDVKTLHNYYLYGLHGPNSYTRIRNKGSIIQFDNLLGKSSNRNIPFPFRKITRLTTKWLANHKKKPQFHVALWTDFIGKLSSEYRNILVIHDMAHHYYPQFTWPGHEQDLSEQLKDHAHKADLILCVSENTKRDVMNILGVPESKIWVTYNGVSEEFGLNRDKSIMTGFRKRYGLPDRFILFVGTVEPRKNLIKLIEAWHLLYSRNMIKEPLVIVGGKGWKNESLYMRVKELKLEDKLIFTGYVPAADLPLFYNAATVFVYPSLYEGFGIPVIEAMACGVPVVTSNVSSLPEVAADAALLVNPQVPEEIAAAIHKILNDNNLSESLREKGFKQASKFTWSACAKKTLKAIEYVTSK